jgi:quinol monooxygenase YgiN
MILFIIRMKVLAAKRKEISQTITSLIAAIRMEKGCRRCDFYRSMENENELCLLQEWDTRKNLNGHLKSERFKVLRGAMKLLQDPCEMMVHILDARRKKHGAESQHLCSQEQGQAAS